MRGFAQYRRLFLQAIEQRVPAALDSLVALTQELPDRIDFDALARDPRVRAWAERWHFTDRWMFHIVALNTVSDIKQGRFQGHWNGVTTIAIPRPEQEEAPLQVAGWRLNESAEAFHKRGDSTLRKYIRETKKRRWNSYGWGDGPFKGKPYHFDWLALTHVGGRSYVEISERTKGGDESTVRKAVEDTAENFVGITLRKMPITGRPRKGRK